jgi:hypothetical protein
LDGRDGRGMRGCEWRGIGVGYSRTIKI